MGSGRMEDASPPSARGGGTSYHSWVAWVSSLPCHCSRLFLLSLSCYQKNPNAKQHDPFLFSFLRSPDSPSNNSWPLAVLNFSTFLASLLSSLGFKFLTISHRPLPLSKCGLAWFCNEPFATQTQERSQEVQPSNSIVATHIAVQAFARCDPMTALPAK